MLAHGTWGIDLDDLDIEVLVADYNVGDTAAAQGISAGPSSSYGSDTAEESLAETLLRLRLQRRSIGFPHDIDSTADNAAGASPKLLGRMYFVWGRTYKTVCKLHPRCWLMVNQGWFVTTEQAQRVSYEWIARAADTTEQQHYTEACRTVELYNPSRKRRL